jgi:hypothetical protein
MHTLYDYYLRRMYPTFVALRVIYPELDTRRNFQLLWDGDYRPQLFCAGERRVWLVLHSMVTNSHDPAIPDFTQPLEREYKLTESYNFPSWTVMLHTRPSGTDGAQDAGQPLRFLL